MGQEVRDTKVIYLFDSHGVQIHNGPITIKKCIKKNCLLVNKKYYHII